MTDRIYLPLAQYVDRLLPPNLIDLPDVELLAHIWIEPPNISGEPAGFRAALLFEAELDIGIPGLNAVRLVLGAEGKSTGFLLEVVTAPAPGIRLIDLPVVLRFDKEIL